MSYDYRIMVCLVLGVALAVYGVFLWPPLTSGGSAGSRGISQAEFDAVVSEEMTYCSAQPDDINCECFARKSGNILTYDKPRVPGAVYADQRELARSQAARNC